MKFIAGHVNGEYLRNVHEAGAKNTECVKAAVAYASGNPLLLEDCWNKKIKLEYWCRYDFSLPVTPNILERFLQRKSPNFTCKLVPDIFHPKVIWWVGYGAYIGSANMNENSWYGNIEAGVFLDESELITNNLESELHNFFREIDEYSHPLTYEILAELKGTREDNRKLDIFKEKFDKSRILPIRKPLTYNEHKSRFDRNREEFLKEWNSTLQILRDIGDRLSTSYRPSWVSTDVPNGIHADRFLNSFYYTHAMNRNKSIHEELYAKNCNNPEKALVTAMKWWQSQPQSIGYEDTAMHIDAPFLMDKLKQNTLLNLNREDFIEVCSRINAILDHCKRVKYTVFGDSPLPKMNIRERLEVFAKWLYSAKSLDGHDILETLTYVLYSGDPHKTPERIWEALNSSKWKIPQLGISSLGEIVGWAMPDIFPPRNGRTSKALRALGYNVSIHV